MRFNVVTVANTNSPFLCGFCLCTIIASNTFVYLFIIGARNIANRKNRVKWEVSPFFVYSFNLTRLMLSVITNWNSSTISSCYWSNKTHERKQLIFYAILIHPPINYVYVWIFYLLWDSNSRHLCMLRWCWYSVELWKRKLFPVFFSLLLLCA